MADWIYVVLFVVVTSGFFAYGVNKSIDREKYWKEYNARRNRRKTDKNDL